jgi:hypothetical protein
MLSDVKDRKKTYKFLQSFYKGMLEYDKCTSKVIIDFGATTRQLKNIIDNKTEHYIGSKALNLKQIFIKTLERSLDSIVLVSVEKHNIKVEDFLDLSRKMNIDENLIVKAEKKHEEYNRLDEFERRRAYS